MSLQNENGQQQVQDEPKEQEQEQEQQQPSAEAKRLQELEQTLAAMKKQQAEAEARAKEAAKEAERYKSLGVSPDDIQSMLEANKQQEEKTLLDKGEFDKLRERLESDHAKKLTKTQKEYQDKLEAATREAMQYKDALNKHHIHQGIRKTIGGDVISDNALEQVIQLVEPSLKLDGSELKVIDKEGNDTFKTVESFLAEFKETNPHFFKGSLTSGTGYTQSAQGGGSKEYQIQQALQKGDLEGSLRAKLSGFMQ